jgi:C4-dicarboxylate-specific signal transduction histidine kinase
MQMLRCTAPFNAISPWIKRVFMEKFEKTPLNRGITLRQLPFFLAMTAAGLAGNYFNFLLFLNINFLFGSIFSMLALQCFGFAPGILAAAIISGYTYILWSHPYVIIIMTAEAAVVGWLMSRRKMKMVLADMLYWLIIGIPLVYLFFHVVMHSSLATAAVLANKLIVNGIANVLIARLIFTGFSLRSHSLRVSFSEIIYNMLAFFVLCPSLIMLAVGSRTDFAETDKYIRSILIQDSRNVEQYLKTWINKREIAVANLAAMAASMSPQQIQPYLELIAKSDTDFLRIGLLNKDAITTAYYPLSDELGQQNIGKNFADRPFIPTLKQTLKPMPSEVVMGRVGIPRPMVTMLAPVVIGGEYGGYVSGILSLEQIRAYLDVILHYNGTLYTLIDINRNVIMTNCTDQKVMARFERSNGTIHPLDAQMSQWEPLLPANTSATERSAKSLYVTEITLGEMATWKVILEQPVAPFQQKLYNTYSGKLSLLFLILIAALLLSEWLSRRLLVALEKLSIMTRDFPGRLLTDGKDTVWFESGIMEVNHLIHNFRQMADTLTGQFHDLQQAQNALKQAYSDVEMQVRDRTAELNATNTALLAEIAERKQAEAAVSDKQRLLEELNQSLEERIEKAVKELRQKDQVLIQQNRMAAMGEMIGNIAHQWRQPLNSLSLVIANIQDAYRFNELDAEYMDKAAADCYRLIQKMSTTISDFFNFFRPNKKISFFSARKQIQEAISLVQASFTHHNIAIHLETAHDAKLMGLPNEYSQVLLNLLSNARDAILAHKNGGGSVHIRIENIEDTGCVMVRDNGGGIPEDILEKIFDPYFTTRPQGSGIGLYMSKMIIEGNMNGRITAHNVDDGAEFVVSVPLAASEAGDIAV